MVLTYSLMDPVYAIMVLYSLRPFVLALTLIMLLAKLLMHWVLLKVYLSGEFKLSNYLKSIYCALVRPVVEYGSVV